MNDHRVAVSAPPIPYAGDGPEVPDLLDWKDPAISPDDAPRLHIADGVKVGVDLYIYLLRLGWFLHSDDPRLRDVLDFLTTDLFAHMIEQ